MEWQPIETAPKDGTLVDLWDKSGFRWTNKRWACHDWRNGKPMAAESWGQGDTYGPGPDPTHWMPLPKPPEAP